VIKQLKLAIDYFASSVPSVANVGFVWHFPRAKRGRKRVKGRKPIELCGLFLDLNIEFSGGHLVRFGPPKLLSSTETLARFSESSLSGRTFMPLSLSLLSERVTALALRAPDIRSGPPKAATSSASHETRSST
jgi:hypothetical protein